jgi:hypothetical protein
VSLLLNRLSLRQPLVGARQTSCRVSSGRQAAATCLPAAGGGTRMRAFLRRCHGVRRLGLGHSRSGDLTGPDGRRGQVAAPIRLIIAPITQNMAKDPQDEQHPMTLPHCR